MEHGTLLGRRIHAHDAMLCWARALPDVLRLMCCACRAALWCALQALCTATSSPRTASSASATRASSSSILARRQTCASVCARWPLAGQPSSQHRSLWAVHTPSRSPHHCPSWNAAWLPLLACLATGCLGPPQSSGTPGSPAQPATPACPRHAGINYVPNQYLLDPRYAPPQQYIMSKQTPR